VRQVVREHLLGVGATSSSQTHAGGVHDLLRARDGVGGGGQVVCRHGGEPTTAVAASCKTSCRLRESLSRSRRATCEHDAVSRICVFCGANPGGDPAFADTARALGAALAGAGHSLVYGGGRVGLMGILADAALADGGHVAGFIPQALVDREVAHTGLTELVVTDSMHTRKAAMCDRADGFVALPGGYGTLDEVLEILTWNQIGTIAKPVAFLDVGDYFGSLFAFFDDAVDAGLIKAEHRAMAQRASSVGEALAIAAGPAPVSPSKWTDPTVR
jgi:uncharacterized protein (TIGR00730 family)